jgi:hypothetical protein
MRIDKKASGSFRSRAETGMPGSSWEYQKTQNRCHVSGIGPARLLTILLRKLPGEVREKVEESLSETTADDTDNADEETPGSAPQTPSTFHPRAQRSASRRPDVRQQ